jgi:hypothetical protein
MFIADSPDLDFLNSIGTPEDTIVEWLANGEDLLAWLEEAKLVDPDRTNGRARRWCSMAICGNRAKQAAHRQRAAKKRKSATRRRKESQLKLASAPMQIRSLG